MKKSQQGAKQSKLSTAEVKISRVLRRARLNKGYSLNDLYRITKIKPQYLKAIEMGRFSKLPEGFYVRAFIKKYADTVGLDGSELLKRFNNYLPDVNDPHFMNRVSEDRLLIRAEKDRAQSRHSTVRKFIPLVILVIVVLLVLVGVWLGAAHYHGGLTTNSDSHSTSISGASLSKRSHDSSRQKETRIRKRARRRIVIKHRSTKNGKVVYQVTTRIKDLHLSLIGREKAPVSIKTKDKTLLRFQLKPNRVKRIKIPTHAKVLQINVTNGVKFKARINRHRIKFNHKPQIQSIILKFSK